MTAKEQVLKKLKELKPKLRDEYSMKEIGIFGSYAEGSETDQSDIDI
ncbi:MAG: nucleotidyltransferase domain-containing protein [Bacteroidia bacterium]